MSSLSLTVAGSPPSRERALDPVPPLVERLDRYLERRERSGVALSPGEVVTLLVALMREEPTAGRTGPQWWLTAEGRPVPIGRAEGDAASSGTHDVLRATAAMCDDGVRGLVDEVRAAIAPVPDGAVAALERRAFTAASPRPLILGPLIPVPHDDVVASRTAGGASVAALLDADLRTAVLAAADEARGWWKRYRGRSGPDTPDHGSVRRGRRWLPWLLAGAAAATVVAAGMALPPGIVGPVDADVAASPTPSTTPVEGHASVADTPVHAAPPGEELVADAGERSAAGDPLSAAQTLLSAYAECAGDTPCITALRESPPDADEAVPLSPTRSTMTLVDDFGGLAVVRVDAESTRQFVTIVRTDDRWLVRAVRAVTDQPS